MLIIAFNFLPRRRPVALPSRGWRPVIKSFAERRLPADAENLFVCRLPIYGERSISLDLDFAFTDCMPNAASQMVLDSVRNRSRTIVERSA
jgi:hypothetical protein